MKVCKEFEKLLPESVPILFIYTFIYSINIYIINYYQLPFNFDSIPDRNIA